MPCLLPDWLCPEQGVPNWQSGRAPRRGQASALAYGSLMMSCSVAAEYSEGPTGCCCCLVAAAEAPTPAELAPTMHPLCADAASTVLLLSRLPPCRRPCLLLSADSARGSCASRLAVVPHHHCVGTVKHCRAWHRQRSRLAAILWRQPAQHAATRAGSCGSSSRSFVQLLWACAQCCSEHAALALLSRQAACADAVDCYSY